MCVRERDGESVSVCVWMGGGVGWGGGVCLADQKGEE